MRKDVVFGPSSAKTGAARRLGGKHTAAALGDGRGYARVSLARRARPKQSGVFCNNLLVCTSASNYVTGLSETSPTPMHANDATRRQHDGCEAMPCKLRSPTLRNVARAYSTPEKRPGKFPTMGWVFSERARKPRPASRQATSARSLMISLTHHSNVVEDPRIADHGVAGPTEQQYTADQGRRIRHEA